MTQSEPQALSTETTNEDAQYLRQALEANVLFQSIAGTLADIDLQPFADVEVLLPFIHTQVGHREMEAMPRLRLIATRSTGFDHIDLQTASERGIIVSNVPGYGETAVAEFAFALLLTLTRKVHQADARTRLGDFTLEGLRGFDLYGKTLGVIGAGAIGQRVIRIANGFGMHVLVFDEYQRQKNRNLAEVLGFAFTNLDQLLKQSDVVTLHAPSIPSTYHMLNHETLSKMKRGSYLINTARGTLIDTKDLAWALHEGILAGAALDTIEGEEFLEREEELLNEPGTEEKLRVLVQNNRLHRIPNVIITPHIAFNSTEALRRILDTTIENVQAFLAGHPQNIVNK